jgi:hypothetical protein
LLASQVPDMQTGHYVLLSAFSLARWVFMCLAAIYVLEYEEPYRVRVARAQGERLVHTDEVSREPSADAT